MGSRIATLAAVLFGFGTAFGQDVFTVPETTTIVEGRLVDQLGEPVPAARIEVVCLDLATGRPSDLILGRGTTDGEGRFVVGRVPQRAGLVVRAIPARHCAVWVPVDYLAREPQLATHETATVRGVLLRRDGTPVAGAVVRADSSCLAVRAEFVEATTGADGAFELRKVAIGDAEVVAAVPDEGLALATVHVVEDTVIDLRVPKETTSLKLRVEGVPAGLADELQWNLMGLERRTVVPPAWDRLRFPADAPIELREIPDVSYGIAMRLRGHRLEPTQLRTEMGQGPHSFVLSSPIGTVRWPLRINLSDAAGARVPGVRLQLRSERMDRVFDAEEGTTDRQGAAVIETVLREGTRVEVVSADPGWAITGYAVQQDRIAVRGQLSLGTVRFDLIRDGIHDLVVEPTGRASGRVLLGPREPGPGVIVELQGRFAAAQPWWYLARARTDGKGNYNFEGVYPGCAELRVGRPYDESDCVVVTELTGLIDAGLRFPDLRCKAPAVVEGLVRAADGAPSAGRIVWLHRVRDGTGELSMIRSAVTGRSGRYRFADVSPGTYRVSRSFGVAGDAEPFELASGQRLIRDQQFK